MSRKMLLIALIPIIFFHFNFSASAAGIKSKNPVAGYTFDKCNTCDDSGNENNGTAYGGVTFVDGVKGKAANFDGTSGYIKIKSNTMLNLSSRFSIGMWIKSDLSQNSIYTLISKGHNQFNGWAVQSAAFEESGELYFTYGNGIQFIRKVIVPGTCTLDKNWHFIVITKDPVNGLKAYNDGILIKSYPDDTSSISKSKDFDLIIGKDSFYEGGYFKGLIDEIQIYDYALSDSEIMQYYENTKPFRNTLLARYTFNNCDAADDSGNENNGSVNGGVTFTDGVKGKAANFDGKSGYIKIKNNTMLNFSSKFSICMWIKGDPVQNQIYTIISKGHYPFNGWIIQSEALKEGGEPYFLYGDGNKFVQNFIAPDSSIIDGVWHFIAITKDPVTGLKTYKDGLRVSSHSDAISRMSNPHEFDLIIGMDTVYAGRYFKGLIDEVQIYDYALSDDEIIKYYKSTK